MLQADTVGVRIQRSGSHIFGFYIVWRRGWPMERVRPSPRSDHVQRRPPSTVAESCAMQVRCLSFERLRQKLERVQGRFEDVQVKIAESVCLLRCCKHRYGPLTNVGAYVN